MFYSLFLQGSPKVSVIRVRTLIQRHLHFSHRIRKVCEMIEYSWGQAALFVGEWSRSTHYLRLPVEYLWLYTQLLWKAIFLMSLWFLIHTLRCIQFQRLSSICYLLLPFIFQSNYCILYFCHLLVKTCSLFKRLMLWRFL